MQRQDLTNRTPENSVGKFDIDPAFQEVGSEYKEKHILIKYTKGL